MTHRIRRPVPTLPARRGMLAPWFRGRAPLGIEPPPAAGDATPDAGTPDADEPEAAPGSTPSTPSRKDAIVVTLVRPAFGHPTF